MHFVTKTFAALLLGLAIQQVSAQDTTKFTTYKDLPLKPQRKVSFTTTEGTWTSLDISPDGKTIVFDMMGDLFTVPVTGGTATNLTRGLAFDSHPRWSPDGKKILFSSDRSGAENIWWIDVEKKDTFQVTKEHDQNFPSATWTPDGDYIVYSKGKMQVQLYLVHKNGGGGTQLISSPANYKTIDPAVSPDGRYIYFSGRTGPWNYNAGLPQYELAVYDRETGKVHRITSRYGSAFTPVLSRDGQWLVYGSRFEDKTGLVIRSLATGDEHWLAYPVQRDDQESIATMGVLPGMAFTPDSKAVIASYGGKIHRIPVDGSAPVEIPFSVNLELEMGPRLAFKFPVSDSAYGLATQIRDAVPSPDGKKLAFTVLDRLYVMDYPNGTPRRLTGHDFVEAQPSWSRDGKSIVFISWTSQGGHIYKVAAAGGPVQELTKAPALYQNPVFDNEGNRIVFLRSTAQKYHEAFETGYDDGEEELCWMPAAGGDVKLICRADGRGNPHFVRGEDRIYLNNGGGDLLSINWLGTDEKTIAHITGITTYGISIYKHGRPDMGDNCMLSEKEAEATEMQQPSPAGTIFMSPTGKRVIAQINNEIYMATIPETGKTVTISVADAGSAQFPARKLTELGGEFPSWEADGKKVHWSLGSAHFVYDVDAAQAFDDSMKVVKKMKADSLAKVKPDTTAAKKDSTKKDPVAPKKDKEPSYKAMETAVKVYYQRDMPQGVVVLKGARIITMEGDQVIENGDMIIENNRIKALGA